jgi:hypothetical protein
MMPIARVMNNILSNLFVFASYVVATLRKLPYSLC